MPADGVAGCRVGGFLVARPSQRNEFSAAAQLHAQKSNSMTRSMS